MNGGIKCTCRNPARCISKQYMYFQVAHKIYERHTVLSNLLIHLGVSEEVAVEDACKLEHDISDETFAAIKEHVVKNIDSLK